MSGKRSARGLFLLLPLMLGALIFGISQNVSAAGQDAAPLSTNDCVKCHATQPADISSAGGKHAGFPCQDCHTGHRPASKNNIPECNMCHAGEPHFELTGCLGCHKNPHTPLKITFSAKMTEPCLTCHTNQNKQLTEHKSKHSALFCTSCHGVHRVKPPCTQCHKPHSDRMTKDDCTKCHKAHMPKDVAYDGNISSEFCAACHKQPFEQLAATTTKHKTRKCATCHQEKHKMVPKCQLCHGDKHPAGIMTKFTKCGDCHNIAHDLNNWKSVTTVDTSAKKKK